MGANWKSAARQLSGNPAGKMKERAIGNALARVGIFVYPANYQDHRNQNRLSRQDDRNQIPNPGSASRIGCRRSLLTASFSVTATVSMNASMI